MSFSAFLTLDVSASLAALRVVFANPCAASDVVFPLGSVLEIFPTAVQNFWSFDFAGTDALAAGAASANTVAAAIATTKIRIDVIAVPSRRGVVRADEAYARSVTVPWHHVWPSAPTNSMIAPSPSGTAL